MFKALLVLLSFSFQVTEDEVKKSTIKMVSVTETPVGINEKSILHYFGSGTVIKKTDTYFDVLTCQHIEPKLNRKSSHVHIWDNSKLPATILHKDEARDLAIWRVLGTADVRAVEIATQEDYSINTSFYKAGFPNGNAFKCKKGVSLGMFKKSNESNFFSFLGSVEAISGDSGGGIHRIPDGKLIGVTWGCRDDTLRARMIPEIHDFIKNSNWK